MKTFRKANRSLTSVVWRLAILPDKVWASAVHLFLITLLELLKNFKMGKNSCYTNIFFFQIPQNNPSDCDKIPDPKLHPGVGCQKIHVPVCVSIRIFEAWAVWQTFRNCRPLLQRSLYNSNPWTRKSILLRHWYRTSNIQPRNPPYSNLLHFSAIPSLNILCSDA